MTPRTKSSILWGLVGALTFLVLVQGYQLVVERLTVGVGPLAGVALGVGALAAAGAYVAEPRLRANERT